MRRASQTPPMPSNGCPSVRSAEVRGQKRQDADHRAGGQAPYDSAPTSTQASQRQGIEAQVGRAPGPRGAQHGHLLIGSGKPSLDLRPQAASRLDDPFVIRREQLAASGGGVRVRPVVPDSACPRLHSRPGHRDADPPASSARDQPGLLPPGPLHGDVTPVALRPPSLDETHEPAGSHAMNGFTSHKRTDAPPKAPAESRSLRPTPRAWPNFDGCYHTRSAIDVAATGRQPRSRRQALAADHAPCALPVAEAAHA